MEAGVPAAGAATGVLRAGLALFLGIISLWPDADADAVQCTESRYA